VPSHNSTHEHRYPLDILRNKALEKQEQEIARKLWEHFMAKMITQQNPKSGTDL